MNSDYDIKYRLISNILHYAARHIIHCEFDTVWIDIDMLPMSVLYTIDNIFINDINKNLYFEVEMIDTTFMEKSLKVGLKDGITKETMRRIFNFDIQTNKISLSSS